jgi:hypothetical protein
MGFLRSIRDISDTDRKRTTPSPTLPLGKVYRPDRWLTIVRGHRLHILKRMTLQFLRFKTKSDCSRQHFRSYSSFPIFNIVGYFHFIVLSSGRPVGRPYGILYKYIYNIVRFYHHQGQNKHLYSTTYHISEIIFLFRQPLTYIIEKITRC